MRKKNFLVFLILFLLLFQSAAIAADISAVETGCSSVSLELDKTKAGVGEIIKASFKIQGFGTNLSGYQVNIKFDPDVLQAVNPYTGEPYNNSTFPTIGGEGDGFILTQSGTNVLKRASHNLNEGILDFVQNWLKLADNPSKNDVYAEIGFKVLKEDATKVLIQNCNKMPGVNNGIILFDWDNSMMSTCDIIQPPEINPVTVNPSVSLELDKTTAKVGEIIKASMRIEGLYRDLIGYQVNIKFDQNVLMAVNPYSGKPYDDYTFPIVGGEDSGNIILLSGLVYPPVKTYPYEMASHDLKNGILNFGEEFGQIKKYTQKTQNPHTNDIYAEIGFKVLKEDTTKVAFQDNDIMPCAIDGTLLFNWDNVQIKDYAVNQPPEINGGTDTNCKVSGYIMSSNGVKAGFKVIIKGTSYSVLTDNNGKFEFPNTFQPNGKFSILITKRGYLDREIDNIIPKSNINIGSEAKPVDIWPGDVIQNDNINAINMVDIMEIARRFNSIKGDPRYDSDFDFNSDEAINLADILIICSHFNTSVLSYPEVIIQ